MSFCRKGKRRTQVNKFRKMIRVKNNLSFIGIIRCYSSRISRQVDEEHQEKVSKVAIIGMPNSGKSTLINSLMSHRVSKIYLL